MNLNLDLNELKKIDINKFLKRQDTLIILAVLVLGFFVSRAVYQKGINQAGFLQEQLKEQKEVSKLSLELERLEGELAVLQKNVPAGTVSTVVFVNKITDLAKKRNISISSISPKSSIDKGLYLEYPFEIEMEADYHQSGGFLSDIENSPDLYKVSVLSVSELTTATGAEAKRSKIKMAISAFTWKK